VASCPYMMDLLPPLLLLVSSPATLLSSPTTVDSVVCQPGHAPSQLQISYPTSPCEPCLEEGVLYPGNNVFLAPSYGVDSVEQCRNLCREETRCHYFTFDTQNNWCYMKTDRNQLFKQGNRYISGSGSILCESDDENEIEDDKEQSENITEYNSDTVEEDRSSPPLSTPILSVYHQNGYRTVLTAIPASFGLSIQNDTELSGRLVQVEDFMCSLPRNNNIFHSSLDGKQFAVVRRGVCKFAVKVETAVKAGFDGVVILDDQNNTEVKRISGKRSSLTENIPVVFLLRKEATILAKLLAETPNRTATIQDSVAFSWVRKTTTTAEPAVPTLTTLQRFQQQNKKFLMGMRDHPFTWSRQGHKYKPQPPPSHHPSNTTSYPLPASTLKEVSTQTMSPRGLLEMTPLTMGSIIVGILFFVLLLSSVGTLIVSKYTKRAKRRANHTRCQLAIRQMEANSSLSQDNPGFSPDSSATAPPTRLLPKSTYSLLECPVCLELAWPPKRIYQCREGHIVCDVCKSNPNLRNCPMCRIPFATNFTSRNRQLEELARTLKEEDQLEKMSCMSTGTVLPSAPELEGDQADTSGLLQSDTPPVLTSVTVMITAEVSSAPQLPEPEDQGGQDVIGGQVGTGGPLVVNLPPEVIR